MDEIRENIKKNTRILLARNTPVALVVGAASFFGSHLVDKLLSKDIQVIGADDLDEAKKDNLTKASENKNFHLVNSNWENMDLELNQLDYLFIVPQNKKNFTSILELFKKLKPRLLLISSIELYENEEKGNLEHLRKIELDIARVAKDENLNARILRLGSLFGPRMSFGDDSPDLDPIIKLIQESLTGDLQKDSSLEFSSRALYISDACDLAIKCIFAGATAQKIFDGISPSPIKVSEIKQVLLDPVWYENKHFTPTELPPWHTPNLEKTIKFLNWHPKTKLVEDLRLTLNYFKDNEIKVPKLEIGKWKVENGENKKEDEKWKMEKNRDLAGLKSTSVQKLKKIKLKKSSLLVNNFFSLTILIFISFALIWPIFQLGWGILTFRFQLSQAINDLGKGEFDKSLSAIDQAQAGVSQAKAIFYSLEPLRKTGLLKSEFELGDNLVKLTTLSADSAKEAILGVENLIISLRSVTGEISDSPKSYFDLARSYLTSADEDLSKADALINNPDFKSNLPKILKPRIDSLSEKLTSYSNLVKKGRSLSLLLPEAVALQGSKNYLVILQNNNELRPTGGFIGSFAKVSFEAGKLKKLEVNDTYAIDGQLKIHVEPPKEIKDDLSQKDYFLRDANWEPDFPTSARQVEWFYAKETGERVAGVVALDISAMEELLSVLGPLDLTDYNEQIRADNLFEKSISHAEVNFFPGTQAKKSFLTALTTTLFNKLFFLPHQNWSGIVTSLGKSLASKHMSIYLDDPFLFSYVISQNWGAVLPRPATSKTEGLAVDFLAPVEANLGANKANYYLDRNYNLETVIGKDGEVSQRLRIAYTNRSPSEAFPAGKYKNRMRVYLPINTKLNRVLWGESEITKDVKSFSDYGRSGFSFLLQLAPKEQKTLVLDYQTPTKLDFIDKKAAYRLDIVKQAGTLKDPFNWRVTYPINVRISSNQAQKISPQEYSIQTDLSEDRTFQLEFTRP